MKIRQKDCVCEVPQHVAVLGDENTSAAAPRVESGPIAVMPENHDDNTIGGSQVFRDAVIEAGETFSLWVRILVVWSGFPIRNHQSLERCLLPILS